MWWTKRKRAIVPLVTVEGRERTNQGTIKFSAQTTPDFDTPWETRGWDPWRLCRSRYVTSRQCARSKLKIPTPAQPTRHYGVGVVNYHTGETVVLIKRHKRRQEIAEFLQTLVDKHPTGTIFVAWDNATTHEDDEVEAIVRGAAGRLVLLYLPTYSPWLNPIEMLWRHFRREVTHNELFPTEKRASGGCTGLL